MKIKILIILIYSFFYSSAKVNDKVFSIASAGSRKAVFVNKKPLNTIKGNEFRAGEYELKTQDSSLNFILHEKLKIKLFPQSEVFLRLGHETSDPISFNLKKGKVYFKNGLSSIEFKIDKLFKFNIELGDFFVEFDEKTKNSSFTTFETEQKIQVEDDDRVNVLKKNHKVSFMPEWSEGEIVYDFLLNNRKIPKFKLRQEPAELMHKIADNEWKLNKKPKLKENESANKEINKESNKQSKIICTKPKGVFANCYWIKKDQKCHRYYCNLNGEWSQKTEFNKSPDCPENAKILPCEWMK